MIFEIIQKMAALAMENMIFKILQEMAALATASSIPEVKIIGWETWANS